MTATANLERAYRRWLTCYPREFRRQHGEEMLGVLLAGAREGQRRPELRECLDLLRSALVLRVRPRVPRSYRSVVYAVRLMYLGAVVEIAAAITIVATMGDVRSNVVKVNPGLTAGQWHAVVAGQLEPTAVAAALAVGFWLWMARSIGRNRFHRAAIRIAFALFFGLNTWGLFNGLAGGSAVYARPDLAIGIVLWLVELATLALLVSMKMAVSPSGARRNTLTTGGWGSRKEVP
ncbi:MAG TPA: hypothetical protein VFE42_16320 [Chloroflexota bacterium]|nr:hypothetical protein [Chloroflexota bacterium]